MGWKVADAASSSALHSVLGANDRNAVVTTWPRGSRPGLSNTPTSTNLSPLKSEDGHDHLTPCVRSWLHACVRACMRACLCACVRECMRMCVRACVRSYDGHPCVVFVALCRIISTC
eukprot:gnl/MRDRNA2_/MRDRNA2_130554_c0_seq1.p2 gnl/MRDRNA2_/MRDRNA2_130554_c0~~gnl/MRDRNA2_/MRDRNA2_130554_c0_seq1.p2  ORF type:complete len:117 (-),score=3.65 gnl/MRDRNA2_/MRDRNA2_130554_c0_seq1:56-406(-)